MLILQMIEDEKASSFINKYLIQNQTIFLYVAELVYIKKCHLIYLSLGVYTHISNGSLRFQPFAREYGSLS